MEAVQAELNTLRNEVDKYKLKNNLLKTEYQKIKEQNVRFKKLIKEINKNIAKYIDEE